MPQVCSPLPLAEVNVPEGGVSPANLKG
jgi:hypothetical protein